MKVGEDGLDQKHASTYSRHVMLDVYDVDYDILNDEEFQKQLLQDAAIHIGATIMKVDSVKFPVQGNSVFVILAESHISGHLSPEFQFGSYDLFTCSNKINPIDGATYIAEKLGCKKYEVKQFERGTGKITEIK